MDLFHSLELPSLSTLQLSTIADGRTLAVIMEMCSSTLRHLKLSVWLISAEELLQMLGCTNQLESLEIDHCRLPRKELITDTLLIGLTPQQSSSSPSECRCPQLQVIELVASSLAHISDDVIIKFISARRTMPKQTLRKVCIQFPSVNRDDKNKANTIVERLERDEVNLGGMLIQLTYRNDRYCFVSK
ncbi:hypothetical protein MD484_g2203, partial [Candolleomyces efflorescens]